jgi:hypothetical protein
VAADPSFGQALDAIERAGYRLSGDKDAKPISESYVCSGGVSSDRPENIQALFLKSEDAVASWQAEMLRFLAAEVVTAFRFSEVPQLAKLNMTEHDGQLGQRLSAVRYGVRSRAAVLTVHSTKPPSRKVRRPARKRKASKKRKGK